MMRYKTKYNLLRDEVEKANNELIDNKVFENYLFLDLNYPSEEQDTIMTSNCIVKALVKTIKFYEQADTKKGEQVEEEQTWGKDVEQTCDIMRHYIVKLERKSEQLEDELYKISGLYNTKVDEIKQLKKDIEYQERKNDKLTDENLKHFSTIQERNNEIDALKHMLDRKEGKHVSFNSYFR